MISMITTPSQQGVGCAYGDLNEQFDSGEGPTFYVDVEDLAPMTGLISMNSLFLLNVNIATVNDSSDIFK